MLRPKILASAASPWEREVPPLREDADGGIRIGQTRVTLESVISLYEQGAGAEEIALRFQVLDLHDIYATLTYFLGHRAEAQAYLDRTRQRSLAARRDAERRSPTARIRERLIRHRNGADVQPAG